MLAMKYILFTGATNGIGEAAIRQLRNDDFFPIILARSKEKATKLLDEIGKGRFYVCDFLDRSSIEQVSEAILQNEPKLDFFIGNAGVIGYKKEQLTSDGIEWTVQVNFLAHVILAEKLIPLFKKSNTVIGFTTSLLHRSRIYANYDFSKELNNNTHSQFRAYGRSKAALSTYALLLAEEHALKVHLIDPGVVATGIARSRGDWLDAAINRFNFLFSTPENGAKPILRILNEELFRETSGIYVKQNRIAKVDSRAKNRVNQQNLRKLIDRVLGEMK